MIGLGTIVNVVAIIGGGIIGLVSNKFLKERYQETIVKSIGLAVITMGLGSTFAQMFSVINNNGTYSLSTKGIMMMIVSIALGSFIGELINLDGLLERFGDFLKKKTGSSSDAGFVDAFVTASITVCVGAMAIIGSLQDGLYGDYSTLFAKSILDFVIIIMMSASMGKGCLFSFIPVAIIQGLFTLLAIFIEPVMTPEALANLSYVGNILIAGIGINLIWPKTLRVANMLPSIVIAVLLSMTTLMGS